MITRHFNEETEIMHVYYSENIRVEEVLESDKAIFTDKSLPRDLKILEDAREASYELTVTDNQLILNQARSLIINFYSVLSAFVQDKPLETAINIDYQYSNDLPNFKYRVFTEVEAALNWLSNGYDYASV